MNRSGNRVIFGAVGVGATSGKILKKDLHFVNLPGVHRLTEKEKKVRGSLREAPGGLEYGERRLVVAKNEDNEFGPVITSLKAVYGGGSPRVLWEGNSLIWDLSEQASLYQVRWSPGGQRTYFSTASPDLGYGDWYTHGKLWEYDWEKDRLSLVAYMRDTDFFLPEKADGVYFGDVVLDLSAWRQAKKQDFRAGETVALRPGPGSQTLLGGPRLFTPVRGCRCCGTPATGLTSSRRGCGAGCLPGTSRSPEI